MGSGAGIPIRSDCLESPDCFPVTHYRRGTVLFHHKTQNYLYAERIPAWQFKDYLFLKLIGYMSIISQFYKGHTLMIAFY